MTLIKSKIFNYLFDEFPTYFEIEDVKYKIKSDYRTWIFVSQTNETNLPFEIKSQIIFDRIFENEQPNNIVEAYEKIAWFRRCGDFESMRQSSNKLFCFLQDSQAIYAGFKRIGYTLTRDTHWFEFCAMLVEIMCIDSYFSALIASRKDTKSKNRLRRMDDGDWC